MPYIPSVLSDEAFSLSLACSANPSRGGNRWKILFILFVEDAPLTRKNRSRSGSGEGNMFCDRIME